MNNNYQPEIHDEVMDRFRSAFDLPLCRCHTAKNGKIMRARLSSDRTATIYWLKAQTVIAQLKLPLTAEIKEWTVSGVVFDRWLEIEFVPQLSELPCY